MKLRIFVLLIPSVLLAQSYTQIIKDVENSLTLKSAKQMQEAVKKFYESTKGKNLPTLDLSFTGFRLYETPTITFYQSERSFDAPMGTKNNFKGSISLKYPLFTGFAISGLIDKAKFQSEQARLKTADLKRNLYMGATKLAVAVDTTKKSLEAMLKAQEATDKALQKAQGFFDNGLIPPSELYNIKAKKYQIEANIIELKSHYRQLLNRLSQLLNTKVDSVELPAINNKIPLDKETLLQKALNSREDIHALKAALGMEQAEIEIAQSKNYPTIILAAELKRQGDTPALDGNGYINPDQSYIGATLNWNLFDGTSDAKKTEAAKLKALSTLTKLKEYKAEISQEMENAFLELDALRSKLKSAKMENKAKEEYYKLTLGRFENQLASADELSRSIAELAEAKAKSAIIQNKIFQQYQQILLLTNTRMFENINNITP